MKILRLSTFLLFSMMLIPIGVSAHCKNKHGPGHPHCVPGDPPTTTETKFNVELQEGTVSGVETNTAEDMPSCVGLNKGSKLSAVFPGVFSTNPTRTGCAEFMIPSGAYGGTTIHLGEIAVTQKNTRVILFFTSEPSFQFPNNTFGFQTQRLTVAMEPGPAGSSFQLAVNKTATLTKSHQPDKRLVVGSINIGTIVYTAIPSE